MAAPSLLAHIITEKHLQGLPLYRLEDRFGRDGTPVDRGTMCRWLEDAGATVIPAARMEALATAFCLSTDATGVAVQPIPASDKKRQPCRHAQFFVQIAEGRWCCGCARKGPEYLTRRRAPTFGKQGDIHDMYAFCPFDHGRARNSGERLLIEQLTRFRKRR